jgi:NTP pyrophosphatase (non-canonical NTP hydrolase)
LARVISRKYGEQSTKPNETLNIAEELADILWVLICIANQTGTDLEQAFEDTIKKKTRRDATRHLQNNKLTKS